MSFDELESKVCTMVNANEHLIGHQSEVLYAGTIVTNPKALKFLSSIIESRASLGYPGANYNK